MSRGTLDTARVPSGFAYGALTPSGRPFQAVRLPYGNRLVRSIPQGARTLVWAVPRSLAATYGIEFSFFSSGYLDVSVPRVPLHALWIGAWIREVRSRGFPHSEICGSQVQAPTRSLSQLVTSFIGS